MKYILAIICLILCGCTIPVAPLQKAEIERFAVVEVDLESWVGNYSHGELAYVGKIDGIDEQKFKAKRKARTQTDGRRKEYIFIEPGIRELSLDYSRNIMGGLGRKYFHTSVDVKALLKADRYIVGYSVGNGFVDVWLEDSNGSSITEKQRSRIEPARPPMPIVIVP